jgi:hypothetical protein
MDRRWKVEDTRRYRRSPIGGSLDDGPLTALPKAATA